MIKRNELLIPNGATHALIKGGKIIFFRCVDFKSGTYDFWNGREFYTKREQPPSELILINNVATQATRIEAVREFAGSLDENWVTGMTLADVWGLEAKHIEQLKEKGE